MGEAAAVIGTAITTLGLIAVAIIRQGGQARDSKREGVQGDEVQSKPAAATPDHSGSLIDRLETRLDKVEARLAVVEEELATERTMKWLLVRYAQTILDYLSRHLGAHDAPAPPEPIRHYFPSHFPSRKDPS